MIYADDTPLDLSDNPRSRYEYDAVGQRTAMIDALGNRTTFTYDDDGRVVRTTFADGTFTESKYDKLGRQTAVIDQNGNRTEYQYDALGRLTGVKNALGDWTTYGYDELGNLVSIIDAEERTTRHEFDGVGRRTAVILPQEQRSSTVYDAVGNVATQTDFNGKTISFEYDALDRITAKQFEDGTQWSFTYTPTGLRDIVSLLDENGDVIDRYDYDYNERDWLIQRSDSLGGVERAIAYTYDVAGNRTSVTTPSGTVFYTFDAQNRLDTVIQDGAVLTDYDYDANSNLILTSFSNGTQEAREYDTLNRLTYLENSKGSEILSSYAYTLDKVGNRVEFLEHDGRKSSYSYDELYRLLQEDITDPEQGDRSSVYVYDRVGNRLSRVVDVDGQVSTTIYTYDDNDRLLREITDGEDTIYTYDANGNTLSKQGSSGTTRYTWNDDGRLVEAAIVDGEGNPLTQMAYRYNADGIRVLSEIDGEQTFYLIDEVQAYAQVLEEYGSDGSAQVAYVHGNDLISQTRDGQTSFYMVDGLGSTRVLTDAIGGAIAHYDYEAFGELINSLGTIEIENN